MSIFTKHIIAVILTISISIQFSLSISAKETENYYLYQNKTNLYTSMLVSDVDSAFDLAGDDIYIPAGTYIIKKPIILMGGKLIGAGMDKTIIVADFDDPNQPILLAGATSSIRNIQFCYKDGLVTGKENQGQRVGIFTANYWPTEKGADFTNIKISNVGTGIWSPGAIDPEVINTNGAATGKKHNATCFSATLENVVINDFSYRGIDFNANARTGNIWRNIYISSGKFACDSAFYFSGEESECTIDLLTVADTRARKPIYLSGARAVDSACINLNNIKLVDDNTTYIYADMISELVDAKDANTTYEVVQKILDGGKSLDLSNTEITVSKPLILNNQNIYGGKIIYSGKDKQPVIKISGKCIIDSVIFENTCKDLECGEGNCVGIWLSNDKGKVTNGTSISSCRFINCGTMIYAPSDVEAAACGMTVENLRGENWTYRGIDIQSPNCENNCYYNLYLNTAFSPAGTKYEPEKASSDCAFFLNKSISATVKQLNVEHTSIKQPIVFKDCKDLVVSTVHIEGVSIEKDGRGYINLSHTNGKFGAVDFYWTRAYCKDMGLFVLDDSDENGNEIDIETFLIKGINDPSSSVAEYSEPRGMNQCDIKMFKRDDKYKNPYFISIENYVYFSYQNDKSLLETFYSDYDNITFKKIGQLPAGGDTKSRPVNRLCAGYTTYYDTGLGKLLTWNGKDWQ